MDGPVNRPVLMPAQVNVVDMPADAQIQGLQGETMGTQWSVRVAASTAHWAGPSVEHVLMRRLDSICQQMSHWDDDSELSRFNRAPAHHWQPVSELFAQVMRCALSVAHDSQGTYDPAAGHWVDLWGFGAKRRYDQTGFMAPTPADCEALLTACQSGWADLRVTGGAPAKLWQPGGIRLDLGAIAKGFAVDQLSLTLTKLGYPHHLVEIGGELRGEGTKPDGQPWWVDLELPRALPGDHNESMSPVLALHGLSVATSGDYRRFFMLDGQRLPHTIDPRNGRPIAEGVASVTVVHRECMWADAWSTAMTVLGVDEGLALADQRQLAVFMIHRQGDQLVPYASAAFEAMLE